MQKAVTLAQVTKRKAEKTAAAGGYGEDRVLGLVGSS